MVIRSPVNKTSELYHRVEDILKENSSSSTAQMPLDLIREIQSCLKEMDRSDEALEAEHSKLQSVLAGMTDAYYFYDKEWRFVDINRRAEEYFGRSREDLLGHNVWELYPHTIGGKAWTEYHRAITQGVPVHFETQSSVSPRFFEVHAYPEMGGLAVYLRDITERKKAEEELHNAKEELERRVEERTADLEKANEELTKAKDAAEAAVESKAAFLANMSHELRTPMNAVIGFSNLLLDEPLTSDQKDFIDRIRTSGEVLLALINDILDFSKIEKNKVELEHLPMSLRTIVEEALSIVSIQANDKGLNLAQATSYGTPDRIMGDPGRLRQVLINLLGNAVKFTDKGYVSVSISSKALGDRKHQILFEVRDTGIGIPPERMDMLFLPFSQVEKSISSQRGGTGLGLAISKRLVELMGGEIWAESSPGMGSKFSFTIETEAVPGKFARSSKSALTKKALGNLAENRPLRILVAEDDPSNQRVIAQMLKSLGYRADTASNGLEVLQALERQPYDLVFMDVKMPEMDGLETTREIHKRWPETGPKIIATTAYALEGDREICIEAGMDGYLTKPINRDELATLLQNVITSITDKI
jgi:PAS domain S-box-containing protein